MASPLYSNRIEPMYEANELLDDVEALRARFAEDGYLLLRDIIQKETIEELRRDITGILAGLGWIRGGEKQMAAETIALPCREGEPRYFEAQDQIVRLQSFHEIAHEPGLAKLMQSALGESAFPHPLGIIRLLFPANPEVTTPAHQDYPNNQGTENLTAAWIPLGDCPIEHGPVAVLRGSHKAGLLPLQFHLGAGNRAAVLTPEMMEQPWLSTDFRAGDVLLFPSLTVHRSLENKHPWKMRLSVDYRFQLEGEALTEGCLQPHFNRISWDDIYRDWDSKEHQYYWREKDYAVEPWDPAKHALSESEFKRAIGEGMRYEAGRRQRFVDRNLFSKEQQARQLGQQPALIFGDHTFSFSECNLRANKLANALQMAGVEEGAVVALLMNNRPELHFTVLAAQRLGIVLAPLDAGGDAAKLTSELQSIGPSWLIVDEKLLSDLSDSTVGTLGAERILVWTSRAESNLPTGALNLSSLVASASTDSPDAA